MASRLARRGYQFDTRKKNNMRAETIALINAERTRQDKLHGKQSYDPLGWLPILIEEAGEVSRAVCDGRYTFCGVYDLAQLRQELVHVAAVAVAWIEDIDRKSQEESGSHVFECEYRS